MQVELLKMYFNHYFDGKYIISDIYKNSYVLIKALND